MFNSLIQVMWLCVIIQLVNIVAYKIIVVSNNPQFSSDLSCL